MTRYISTRGEAPVLGFCDVMLTGLARDGGLYVPEVWPQLSHETIASFFGRPYWEVAVDVIKPFAAGEISDADLGRMANEAYATFRHPAVVPLDQVGPNQFVLELFHGPTLAFKDVAMQLISRLMDHVLAKRNQRTTIVVATSGDTGGAAVDAFAGLDNVDLVVLFPNGRISDVQRRMMTTTGASNVHALAIEGTFDDCQAIVKAMFNHHGFRDAVSLSGVNSINWARIVAQVVYYFTSAVALGAPARVVDFTVPTGNFGDIFAGYVAKKMGLPIRWLRIASNVNDILPRTLKTGIYEVKEVHASASPSMDIQISSNFERLLFEASRRDADSVRRLMASLKQSGRFVLPDAMLAAIREEFDAGRADETETAAAIRAAWREAGDLIDPHTAVAMAVADRDTSDSGIPNIVLSTAHPAKFPDAVEAACGVRPQLPAWLDGLMTKSEHITVMKNDSAEVGEIRALGKPRREAGSCRMSVDVTKLPSGLTIVTDTMPHLETAALGVWAGVGGRDEKPNEHGISHLLEHMAFKGTTRRSSREIVEEIEAVGGDLNAGTSTETTAYYARVMKADVPLALDVLSDILANPSFVPDELEREKSVIVQEIGAAQDTPDDVVFEHLNELCFPDQPIGRSLLGTAKTLKTFDRDMLRGYLSTHYRGPDMVVAAAGAVDHKRVVEDVTQKFASFDATPAPKPQTAMFGQGGSRVVHRDLEQAHLTLALEGVPQSDLSLFSLQVFTNTLGGGMSSRLFQEVREKRGLCYSIYTFHAPYADTGFFGLYTGTDPADAPEMMEVIVDVINDAVETLTEAEIARAKAQMKAGLLMALESCSSRAEQLARHILAYGRPLTVEELVARIDAVSVESTRNAAHALLSRSRPAVVALGTGRGLDTAVSFAEGLTRSKAKTLLH